MASGTPGSWTSFHRREDVLRAVVTAADTRRDGRLPMHVDGVAETFADELDLLGALSLRWHTRLAGRIERELGDHPGDPEDAVVAAWRATARELPGIRAILDEHRAAPHDDATAAALRTSTVKERALLAVMAGRAGGAGRRRPPDRRAAREPRPRGPGPGAPVHAADGARGPRAWPAGAAPGGAGGLSRPPEPAAPMPAARSGGPSRRPEPLPVGGCRALPRRWTMAA